jgi:hypothetical protein
MLVGNEDFEGVDVFADRVEEHEDVFAEGL